MKFSIVVILLVLATPLAAQQIWYGNWAAEPAWCEFQDKIGSDIRAPITITEHDWLGYKNSCDIVDWDKFSRKPGWVLTLECFSADEQNLEERVLLLENDDVLWQWWGSGEPQRFIRCEGKLDD